MSVHQKAKRRDEIRQQRRSSLTMMMMVMMMNNYDSLRSQNGRRRPSKMSTVEACSKQNLRLIMNNFVSTLAEAGLTDARMNK